MGVPVPALVDEWRKLPVTKHTAAGRSAVPSSVVRRSTPLLLLASVVQAAEPPTYSPCPVIDRPGHIAEDGSIRKERSAQELATAALEYCDIVAWGRFVSVCDENYHRTTGVLNAEVTVKFAVDDTLFGERHEFVRTRMQRLMLVWPDTDLSWVAHQAVSNRGRLQRVEAAANGRDLLKRLYESGASMTGEQYERLSGLLDRTASSEFSMSPGATAIMLSEETFDSVGGLDFILEMGAVTPERLFLVGFSKPGEGPDDFNELSTMLIWGQEAQDVAEQIRMLSGQGADPRPEEEPQSRQPDDDSEP